MSGDYSRFVYDPARDYNGVLLQQGRPLTDWDWNDLVTQLNRRAQATSYDTFGGAAVVPLTTPDGFKLALNGSQLTIGRGRIYVHGLLAENHGLPPSAWNVGAGWDAALAELYGTNAIPYEAQPYLPDAPALPTADGPYLIYVDVWQREITQFEAPELVDRALGVDTTTRLQTVWQVKALPNDRNASLACDTDPADIPGWSALTAPSAGRLSTGTATYGSDNPCLIPPTGGYTGLENQLYRVEIHDGGAPGTATFTWSRDNASVETRVTRFADASTLVVESVGKDGVLRFNDGDWIEILDDWLELNNRRGELHRIALGGGVDDATRTITLEKPVSAGLFPVDGQGMPAAERNTRICRWDQKGKVQRTDTPQPSPYFDLGSATSTGAIPVPDDGTITLALENGIIVSFDVFSTGGVFKSGDWWVFAARASDASVEVLDHASARGIHHHFAKLGVYTPGSQPTDCRQFWPPSFGGDSCACTICVSPQAHAQAAPSLQQAIDTVVASGGGTVCLEVGDYPLLKPLKIEGARSVKLVGKGAASQLLPNKATSAILVNKSHDIVLDSFSVLCGGLISDPQEAVGVVASQSIRVEHVTIRVDSVNPQWAAIGLAGALLDIGLRENALTAPTGIRSGSSPSVGGETGLVNVRIEDNDLDCGTAAIAFAPVTMHQLVNRICSNRVNGCKETGFLLTGMTAPGFGLEVRANVFSVSGDGIVASLSGLRVLDNDILHGKGATGIILGPGLTAGKVITDCQIVGNRIQASGGTGISVKAPLSTAMIKQNQIAHVNVGLELKSENSVLDQLSIENNQFNDITGSAIVASGKGASYAATGNHIRTRSQKPAVLLDFKGGDGVFSHNECYRDGDGDGPDVLLRSNTLIVDNNRVVGGAKKSFEIAAAPERCTVLGNICRGSIIVDGVGLAAPWAPLNLQDLL